MVVESVAKSDIFFVITSIAAIVLTAFLIVALFYLIKILKNFRDVSDTVNKRVVEVDEKIEKFKEEVRKIPLIGSVFSNRKKKESKE